MREFEAGPDANTARAIELLSPLDGATVLEIGCGSGVLAAWLAREGARVTGIDVSPHQIARAAELHEWLGLNSRFIVAPVSKAAVAGQTFDRLVGRHVLHHLDPPAMAAELAGLLRTDGKAAFVETMGVNPALRFARAHLAGRFGIPRYGTQDERPLSHGDLDALEKAFGRLRLEVAEMQFLRIFDRQVLRYRVAASSRVLGRLDDLLLLVGGRSWSYHQIVFLERADFA